MTTNDKHCQTFAVQNGKIVNVSDPDEYAQVMYDETVPVLNAREVESPAGSEDDADVVKSAMSRFHPPARHDFGSDSDSDSEKFLDNGSGEEESPERKPIGRAQLAEAKTLELTKQGSKENTAIGRAITRQQRKAADSSDNTDSDSAELEADRSAPPALPLGRKRGTGVVIPAEGAYDPKQYQHLNVPPEMENIFQYIMKYTPQKIDIDFKLHPFVPEYVPAVGDVDAVLKVTSPACNVRGADINDHVLEHIDNLGLTVLDEPSAEQSDSALLHLQLRALSKTNSSKSTVMTKKIENAEKNPKSIERWIKDVSELHLSKPPPTVNYTAKMPDIDSLMEEWPESMESALNEVGFPPASLDCSLSEYVTLVCAMFDIPVAGKSLNDSIQALHVLFTLYLAVKNSQLFAEREKEEKEKHEAEV